MSFGIMNRGVLAGRIRRWFARSGGFRLGVGCLGLALFGIVGRGEADTTNWENPTNDNWFHSPNWSDGVPNSSTDAWLHPSSHPTVLSSGTGHAKLVTIDGISSGAVFHILNGAKLYSEGGELLEDSEVLVSGTGTEWHSGIEINQWVGSETGKLTIEKGALVNAGSFTIGGRPFRGGKAFVTGTGTKLTSSVIVLALGESSEGQLIVSDGAVVENHLALGDSTSIGNSSNSVLGSSLVVEDQGTVYHSKMVEVGDFSPGSLTLKNGAVMNADFFRLGNESTGIGELLIGDGGSAGTLNTGTIATGAGQATIQFNHSDNISFLPVITGTVGIIKLNSSTTTLAGANHFTGQVEVDDGSLVFSSSSTFTGGIRVNDGSLALAGSVNLTQATEVLGGSLVLANGLGLSGNGTLKFDGGTLQSTGTASTAKTTTFDGAGATFAIGAGSVFTHSGSISGGGALTKTGTGELRLTGSKAFTGITLVSAGQLTISDAPLPSNHRVDIENDASLAILDVDQTLDDLNVGITGSVYVQNNNLTVDMRNSTVSLFGGTLTGSGALYLTGTGVNNYELTGTLDFVGGIGLTGATLTLYSSPNRIAASNTLAVSGSSLLDLNDIDQQLADLLVSNDSLVDLGSATLTLAPSVAVFSDISGPIVGSGSLRHIGEGYVQLRTANAFAGGISIEGTGTVELGHGSAAGPGGISIASGQLSYVDGIAVANEITLEGDGSLHVLQGSATQNGVIDEFGGSFGLSKTGNGTLVLNGATSHSGMTTISTGTLVLGAGGSLASTSRIHIAAGATFDVAAAPFSLGESQTISGAGSVVGDLNVAGMLAPGNSSGELMIGGNLVLESTSITEIEIGGLTPGTGFDTIHVTGSAVLGGALDLTLLGSYIPEAGDTYTLLTANSLSGGFTDLNSGSAIGVFAPDHSQIGTFNVFYGSGSPYNPSKLVIADFALVPEPSTFLLSAAALLVLLGRKEKGIWCCRRRG